MSRRDELMRELLSLIERRNEIEAELEELEKLEAQQLIEDVTEEMSDE